MGWEVLLMEQKEKYKKENKQNSVKVKRREAWTINVPNSNQGS